MARVIAVLAVFLGIILAINWCQADKGPVRNPKTDCHQPSYKEKVVKLCGSYSSGRHKLVRQTEQGRKRDGRQHRHHHHHKKYHNDFPTEDVLEPTMKEQIVPVNFTTTETGLEKKNNKSFFEESLYIWYLNPVRMGSVEIDGEIPPKGTDVNDRETNEGSKSRNGEAFVERWRRHPSLKKLVMEFFENTCCQLGCFFPDDFKELMEKIC